MDKDCIFCTIANNKVNADFLYKDDTVVVLRDIKPQAPVHLLIIPRIHIRSINDLSIDDKFVVANMIMVGKIMASREKISKSGYKLFFNVEKGGGQVVFHLHMHLIGGWK